MIPFVDLKKQYLNIKTDIDNAIQEVINASAFVGSRSNRFVKIFEDSFAEYLGIKHCISCANGTDAIEIILKAMGISRGDEVIVPSHTWISTAEAVGNIGAIPIFVDTLPDFYTIDVKKIEAQITSRTRAIIPVHLYGQPADMDEIMDIASRHKLFVIEDCAQSHGALYKGKITGTMGHAATFSFFPTKNLGSFGDAGAIVTNNDEFATYSRMYSVHGQIEKNKHITEGRNSRLDGLQAAILSAKLPYLEKWNNCRREKAQLYFEYLKDTPVKLPQARDWSKHVYHLFVLQVENRQGLMDFFKENEVQVMLHYPTILPLLDAYKQRGYSPEQFPVSSTYQPKILSIPMYPEMENDNVKSVAEIIKQFCYK